MGSNKAKHGPTSRMQAVCHCDMIGVVSCRVDKALLAPCTRETMSPLAKQNSKPKILNSGTQHSTQDAMKNTGVVFDQKPSCTIFAFTGESPLVFVEISLEL